MSEATEAPPKQPMPQPQAPIIDQKKKKSRAFLWLTLFLILIALSWFLYWDLYLRYCESTDDAYANGNSISINPSINGSVIAFYADDTDFVHEGDLLAQLDCTYYEMDFQKELATLNAVILQVKQLFNTVEANQAFLENKQTLLEKASYDYKNRLQLVDSQAISNEDFIHSKDDYLIAQLEVKQAQAQYFVSIDAIGNIKSRIEHHPLVEQQKAVVRTAYYRLKHCSIYAPSSGYIAQRSVNVGQWVTPTTPLMALITANDVWVDANFKETQLTKMRIGQPATVWFDLYGSRVVYHGKVLGIASGSGSVFSLIPPQNATGNWIKIVQRLPVRISLDPEVLKNYPSRLGISAEVRVDITNQDLPMLASTPIGKPIAKTSVFDINLDEINKIMDEMINALAPSPTKEPIINGITVDEKKNE